MNNYSFLSESLKQLSCVDQAIIYTKYDQDKPFYSGSLAQYESLEKGLQWILSNNIKTKEG